MASSGSSALASQLAGMDLSALAVWVIDVDRMRIGWANDRAVTLWRAASREDLLARDLSGAPASVLARTQALLSRIRESEGEVLTEEWTLYPKGVATPVMLHLSEVPLGDGRTGILNQVLPSEVGANPDFLRGIEALRHVPVLVALVDPQGTILMQNPAALRAFGVHTAWPDWFVDPDDAIAMLERAMLGESVQRAFGFRTLTGERLHAVHAHVTKDPVSGAPVILVHHTDETDRAKAEQTIDRERELNAELQATLALVEKQRNRIQALSTPVLDVGVGTIAMPIIGEVDEARTREIVARLLPVVVAREAETVILDLTSAVVPDGGSVSALISMVGAIRLLGARPIVTGIQPAFASQLVAIGFGDLDVTVARTLAQGLAKGRGPRAKRTR